MKVIFIVATLMFHTMNASAWISTAPATKSYKFNFEVKNAKLAKIENTKLHLELTAGSYEDAFKDAADRCFKHFKKELGGKLSENQGLDVIDGCANPRS